LPLLAGVALVEAVRRLSEVDAVLKWPNDLMLRQDGEERKCAGILAESLPGEAVVVGFGLNVTLRAHELPRPDATSLALAGAACTDRDPLLRALLRSFESWYGRWRQHAGDPEESGLRTAYGVHCGTLGRRVRVQLPGDRQLVGLAEEIDGDGRLIVAPDSGDREPLAAGDVVYLR
jgi:BirA family biotin operon repressor/biotin-[acetyl-CoA-carboxylase] ligase